MQNEVPPRTPLSLRDIPRVVEKSVNSVSAFGAKSSVHSLAPPFPTEPATLGFGGDPQLGELWCAKASPVRGGGKISDFAGGVPLFYLAKYATKLW